MPTIRTMIFPDGGAAVANEPPLWAFFGVTDCCGLQYCSERYVGQIRQKNVDGAGQEGGILKPPQQQHCRHHTGEAMDSVENLNKLYFEMLQCGDQRLSTITLGYIDAARCFVFESIIRWRRGGMSIKLQKFFSTEFCFFTMY